MTRNHTQPELQIGIIQRLRAWHDHNPLQRPESDWPGVNQTLDEQADLGWDKFVDGFIATSWMATQQSYLEYIVKKTTGKRWASRLIVQLWEITWDMWRHQMKILDNPDSQSLLAQMIILDTQIQERFNRFANDPIPEL
jgi:hypothetical protein